jgi:hypothetical protein
VVAGFVLLVAAAFFGRVIEVTRKGVKLKEAAELVEAFDEAIEGAAVSAGDTGDEVKAKVREGVRLRLSSESDWYDVYSYWLARQLPTDAYDRARMLQNTYLSSKLVATFRDWLEREGWEVQEEVSDEPFRADLIATKPDGSRMIAEARPAVQALQPRDAVAVANSLPHGPHNALRAVVFDHRVFIPPEAWRTLQEAGIRVFKVNIDAGTVEAPEGES